MSRAEGRKPDAARRKRTKTPDAEVRLVGVFRCGNCARIFNTDPNQTVGDVEKELQEDFGITMEEMVDRELDTWILCTTCYHALAPEIRESKPI